MKFGARNQIVGTVTAIKRGNVMGQVTLEVKGPIEMSSVMTVDSIDELKLKKGDKARVIVKAIHVLLATE
ncbi:MAG: molybdenum-binding [Planctomycetota bacterium]|nr:MAG: molybdenum-binding [Planctomycetota bacterium]